MSKVEALQKQKLNLATGVLLVAVDACRKYLCVVYNKHVPLVEMVHNVEKVLVRYTFCLSVVHQQARVVAWLGWVLSN